MGCQIDSIPESEPRRPVSIVNHGGVSFDENIASRYYASSDSTTFYIDLKNRVKVSYPRQNTSNSTRISPKIECENTRFNNTFLTIFQDLKGATIIGGVKDKSNVISLRGCQRNFVDISGNNQADHVILRNGIRYDSRHNKVKQDSEDITLINDGVDPIGGEGILNEDQMKSTNKN
ncbi:hypothetical protein IJ579_04365 [bacterium]|nr:hypothetical protein [bacterium]